MFFLENGDAGCYLWDIEGNGKNMTRNAIFRAINMGRNALHNGNNNRAQALLTNAARAVGMEWAMWKCPMPTTLLVSVAADLLIAADAVK